MEERLSNKITKMSNSEFKNFAQHIIEVYYSNVETNQPSCIFIPQKDWKRLHWRVRLNRSAFSRHDIKKYGMKIKRANCFKRK